MSKYTQAVIRHHADLFLLLEKFINLGHGQKVLDFGCGNGVGTLYLASQGINMTGIDNNQPGEDDISAAQALALEKNIPVTFKLMDGENLAFNEQTFDIILMIDVLEHLSCPQKNIFEAKRVLKDGGKLIIIWQPYYSPFGGHLKFYSINPWRQLMPLFNQEKFLKMACEKRQINSYEHEMRVLNSLNKLTLRKFKKIIKHSGLKIKILKRLPFNLDNSITGLKIERYARIFLNKIPLLPVIEEFTAPSVLIILEKVLGPAE